MQRSRAVRVVALVVVGYFALWPLQALAANGTVETACIHHGHDAAGKLILGVRTTYDRSPALVPVLWSCTTHGLTEPRTARAIERPWLGYSLVVVVMLPFVYRLGESLERRKAAKDAAGSWG